MSFLHSYRADYATSISQNVANVINSWTDETLQNYNDKYSFLPELVLVRYGVGILTHPDLTADQKVTAYESFETYADKFVEYADTNLISDLLTQFTSGGVDLKAIEIVVKNISADQASDLGAQESFTGDIGSVLESIVGSQYDSAEPTPEPILNPETINAIHGFMGSELGKYVSADAISLALREFSQSGNLEGIDALTDYITGNQAQDIGAREGFTNDLGMTLVGIVETQFDGESGGVPPWAAQSPEPNPATITAVRDFMGSELGQYVDGSFVAEALRMFSQSGNLEGIDALTDYITGNQAQDIGAREGFTNDLGMTLVGIVETQFDGESGGVPPWAAQSPEPNPATITAVRDFMSSELGQYVQAPALSDALRMFADAGNLEGLDALTDYITADQAQNIGVREDFTGNLGQVLLGVIETQFDGDNANGLPWGVETRELNPATITAVRDFMSSELGQYVQAPALSDALRMFADAGNLEGLDALTDYITADQAQNIGVREDFTGNLGQVLADIIETQFDGDNGEPSLQPILNPTTINALEDFMESNLSQYIGGHDINNAIETLAASGNTGGVEAVISNLSEDQSGQLNLNMLEDMGIKVGSENGDFLINFDEETTSMHGGDGSDYVVNFDGKDTDLYGGAGDDFVYDINFRSGENDSVISGGDGSDLLYGGNGADTFVFREGETGMDTIWDFNAEEGDRLDISDLLQDVDPFQELIDDFVFVTTEGNDTIVSVDSDGAGGNDAIDIVSLSNVTGIENPLEIIDLSTI